MHTSTTPFIVLSSLHVVGQYQGSWGTKQKGDKDGQKGCWKTQSTLLSNSGQYNSSALHSCGVVWRPGHFVHWHNSPRSGTEVSSGTFVTTPGPHETCAKAYASLTRYQSEMQQLQPSSVPSLWRVEAFSIASLPVQERTRLNSCWNNQQGRTWICNYQCIYVSLICPWSGTSTEEGVKYLYAVMS